MIVGLGVDVIEVERVQNALDRYAEHFLKHVFAPEERRGAPSGSGRASYYAGRWAAKEAVSKALGTGIGEHCAWTDVRVLRGTNGKPGIRLVGAAARTAERSAIKTMHITISHGKFLACAAAVAETGVDAMEQV